MRNQLYLSKENALIGGVCGGIGEFLGINPIVIRVTFILLAFGKGVGLWLYLLFWIIIPLDAEISQQKNSLRPSNKEWKTSDSVLFGDRYLEFSREARIRLLQSIGVALILIGILHLLPGIEFVWGERYYFDQIWPIILIMGGLVFIFRRPRGENKNA